MDLKRNVKIHKIKKIHAVAYVQNEFFSFICFIDLLLTHISLENYLNKSFESS